MNTLQIRNEAQPKVNLEAMNFLNEIAIKYPEAISFASGRPNENMLGLGSLDGALDQFIEYFAKRHAISKHSANKRVLQYGETAGIVTDLVAEQMSNDIGLECTSAQLIMTSGCQEAMLIALKVWLSSIEDVLLVTDPTYIGISGVAEILGVNIASVPAFHEEGFFDQLDVVNRELRQSGKKPKAIYLIPDFDNPTGYRMSLEDRQRLLDYCTKEKMVVLEDGAYGMFRFDVEPIPTLFELDHVGNVVHLGTYSKTLSPSLRVGYLVIPPILLGSPLKDWRKRISTTKSFITVNTSNLSQAIIGGLIIQNKSSLSGKVEVSRSLYQRSRDTLIRCLENELNNNSATFHWNKPDGGFFLTLQLPFDFTEKEVFECAEAYGVIGLPMSFFSLQGKMTRYMRLSYSNVDDEQITKGVARLSAFFSSRT